jgi:hypothetical protein
MLSKHRSENVNNTITRSGGTSLSTNGQSLLLRFNYIMELFQMFWINYKGVPIEKLRSL